MTTALDQWNDRHVIAKEEVDLGEWSLSKDMKGTTALKMRRERLLAIRSAVLKQGMGNDEDEDDVTGSVDQPKPKKKVKGKVVT